MAAPPTVTAAGYFDVLRSGVLLGQAVLRMSTATMGSLEQGTRIARLRGDPEAKTLQGKLAGEAFSLTIKTRNLLSGKIGSDKLDLTRRVRPTIPASEMSQSDSGPPPHMKAIFDSTPDYLTQTGDPSIFWYDFGNVYYRGRLDGSARLLCIASDPGPAECLPFTRRTLIGDSGQKTQGFLAKLGLTRSYVLVNTFAVAMHPGSKSKGLAVLRSNAAIKAARHALYDALLAGGRIEAIIAFGDVAHEALDIWAQANAAVKELPLFNLAHPAAVDRDGTGNDAALEHWAAAVKRLRMIVSPDPDGSPAGPNFGKFFTEVDYTRIPRWDLPRVAHSYIGDDSWGRAATPRHNNCCARPVPDDLRSLILSPPRGEGQQLRYFYQAGRLTRAENRAGQPVAVDHFGIEI